jgi:hypothetical protein
MAFSERVRRTLPALLLVVPACASTSTVGGMRARAAEDWGCPESAISVTNEGQSLFRVSGCGQTALYECTTDESPSPAGSPPQSDVNSGEDSRYQGLGTACHKSSRD